MGSLSLSLYLHGSMSAQKAFLTLDEALAVVMENDDEDELDAIIILPPDLSEVTDEEIEINGTNPVVPLDASGKLEVKSSSKDRNRQESTILKVNDLTTQKTPNKSKQMHSKNCSKPNERREPNEKKHWPKRNWDHPMKNL